MLNSVQDRDLVRNVTYPVVVQVTIPSRWIGSPVGDTILQVNTPTLTFPLELLPPAYYQYEGDAPRY